MVSGLVLPRRELTRMNRHRALNRVAPEQTHGVRSDRQRRSAAPARKSAGREKVAAKKALHLPARPSSFRLLRRRRRRRARSERRSRTVRRQLLAVLFGASRRSRERKDLGHVQLEVGLPVPRA